MRETRRYFCFCNIFIINDMKDLFIPPICKKSEQEALARMGILAKPPGSLGRLENLVVRLAGMKSEGIPSIEDKAVVLFGGDHHIMKHGVSATSSEVTQQQMRNFVDGGATINAFTQSVGARLTVVDVGVDYDLSSCPDIVNRKVMRGANDFSCGPAMTRDQALACVQAGIDMAYAEKEKGLDIIAAGEMGIGNTTPSSAIISVLTGEPVECVTGRGSGVGQEIILRKIELIKKGISLNRPNPLDAIDVLSKVGGLEIGAMAGLMLGAASLRVPFVVDGVIAGAAAALAIQINPAVRHYLIGSHTSAEPAHVVIMKHIGVELYLDFGMCLGEGTGAVLFFPIIQAATQTLKTMKTFPELSRF